MKQPLIILTGPTAVGKTNLSIQLAKAIDGEIISADSMQIYRYMDIGTAKITKAEMNGIPHYLVDELDPADEFNVVRFKEMAKQALQIIYDKGKIPIIAGGTGFYIQALLYDIDFTETKADFSYRKELEALAGEKGNDYLHEQLRKVDSESADAIHPNNVKRVIRALEYYQETGQSISVHNKEQRKKESPYQFVYLVLNNQRDLLYDRIDKRVDQMIAAGLVEEVNFLLKQGYSPELVSMQGLGYKEIIPYLQDEISLDEAVYTLKRDTRHFAKRQLTWFKREREVDWILKQKYQTESELLEELLKLLHERGIKW